MSDGASKAENKFSALQQRKTRDIKKEGNKHRQDACAPFGAVQPEFSSGFIVLEVKNKRLSGGAEPILNGGQGGIRTRGDIAASHAFQACAFDHSATCPQVLSG